MRAWAEIDDGGTPRAIGVTLPDSTYIIRHEPTEAGFRFSLEGFRWREAGGRP